MKVKYEKLLKWLYALPQRYFLPLLLGAVVMNVIFNTYYDDSLVTLATMGFVVYESVLFWFFEKIKTRRILRFFIYCFIGLLVMVLSGWLIGRGWQYSGVSFFEWFYLNSDEVGKVTEYNIFIMEGIGFFMISILYYFTLYRFRIFGVLLITMFPFVIYGKRSEKIDTLSLTFMMTIFLAMMVHQRLVTDDSPFKDKLILKNRSYAIAVALFVTFVGAVTMLLPKPNYISQLEGDKGIFRFDINANTTAYDDLNEVSSPRFGADATGEVLFYVTTSENVPEIYFRRQSFDIYRNEQFLQKSEYRTWYVEDETADSEVNSPLFVYRLMKQLAETGRYEKYGLTEDLFGKYKEYDSKYWLNIQSTTYSPTYIPAPLMANTESLTYCRRTPHGEVYYYDNYSARYGGIGVSYSYYSEQSPEYLHVSELPFSWGSFQRMMGEAMNNGDITPQQYSNITQVYELYTEKGGVTERVEQLAHEITDGYDTDYEKCEAIVDYFIQKGYIYDLEFEPDDESIEYFLFDSKTGVCTSYATAMTLMARAVNIPARYVEGFAAFERNSEGAYVVRDSHAHAFVEVYIAGAGWVTFDPTVPDYKDQLNNNNNNNTGEVIRTFIDYFSKIVLFLAVVFILVFVIFLDRFIECIFRIRLKICKSPAKKSLMLYTRILHLLENSSERGMNVRGMTPLEILALAETRGAEISREIGLFEQVCFGGYTPAAVEFEAAYSCYKKSWKALAGKRRDKKQKGQI
ncbi:transglutaminase domain-containing protein [uncultured Ruminococcus sp.]|uniref:DUF4129 domain-containing transglutaminase family protein n=1 Tax=uncultured Ruminococcus sp. TaxID=165186 RepID=UPI0025E108EC|nr:transglutaminase domain-containing protein [uncultured Ruminococcus sp.]